ncbi:MAG: shikimate kinase [Candidatus Marinimicrobia bacterium]|jgi:shikimate kinase|nr:shikimate kinase [Candidatus Neomarinimicrobiota bacterium]MBT3936803.1 shikimate kinase [Candidatus Neomarinimicrobiota bacterium]MBT3962002.1 shikimate kinase [Candidatus Neomarinimicrobiota bacterium]MBT4383692.1 shikimate kinase [Candidatus Neomarinimicrobiota bacterium]MBT4637167.1 shikimate kinase [Candidatus Neomarinimicrobiota bacterium]
MTIYIIGMMGSGKSTIGKRLAENIEYPFIDLDSYIKKEGNKTIENIFQNYGEEYFRELETKSLKAIMNDGAVISCGGGIVLSKNNHTYLKQGKIIYLEATISELVKRISNSNHRPLLKQKNIRKELTNILEKREKIYLKLSNYTIDTTNKSPDQIIKQIQKFLNENN